MQSSKPTHHDQTCTCGHRHGGGRYYTELAGITTWLFIGVLALMTFLLTVGLQHPQKLFSTFFYFTLALLPMGLIIYAVSHMVEERLHNLTAAGPVESEAKAEAKADKSESNDKDDNNDNKPVASEAPAAKSATQSNGLLSWLRALRMVQQVLFILSLLAVTGLALVSAHIFFAPPTAAPQTQQGQ
jgi:purine-cytosine permease-like protein